MLVSTIDSYYLEGASAASRSTYGIGIRSKKPRRNPDCVDSSTFSFHRGARARRSSTAARIFLENPNLRESNPKRRAFVREKRAVKGRNAWWHTVRPFGGVNETREIPIFGLQDRGMVAKPRDLDSGLLENSFVRSFGAER